MSQEKTEKQIPSTTPSIQQKKLPKLPSNAKVHKRPLLHPQLASPYAGPQQPKTIYVSTNTPFLSAVKRTEKLLRLADKRAVQSATTLVTQNRSKRKRRDADELLEIAETVESEKKRRKVDGAGACAREEVVLKGTGKAIQKMLELALWFQQRNEYAVQLRTGSVGAIDDITVEDIPDETEAAADATNEQQSETDKLAMDIGQKNATTLQETHPEKCERASDEPTASLSDHDVPETRIRYTSVLEVAISLR